MRIKCGKTTRRSKKKWFREAKGRRQGLRRLWRTVKQMVIRSRVFAYRDRRTRKRDFRRLWIIRINAACTMRGLSYSAFIHGLKLTGINLNRKSLSQLAITSPAVFDEIVALVKEALSKKSVASA